ncbi:MAG: outer membrane beta-barrel protein [Bacteroidota bacterium]
MKDKLFDQFISNQLNGVQPNVNADAWDKFESKLEAKELEEQTSKFDMLVRHKLNQNYLGDYKNEHWLLLNERLDLMAYITNRIAVYKFSELIILFLMVFYIGQSNDWKKVPIKENNTVIVAQEIISEDLSNQATEVKKLFPGTLETAKSIFAKAAATKKVEGSIPQQGNTTITSSNTAIVALEEPQTIANSEISVTAKEENVVEDEANALLTELPLLENANITSLEDPNQQLKYSLLAYNDQALTFEDYRLKQLDLLETNFISANNPVSIAHLLNRKEDNGLDFNVSIFGTLDYNRIITPSFKRLRMEGFDRYEAGYGGGLLFGMRWKKWELQTGAYYTAKHINPEPVKHVEGSFRDAYLGESLKEYHFNTLNIPLNFNYELFNRNDWRIYATAGASMSFVFQAKYDVVLVKGKSANGYGLSSLGSALTPSTHRTALDQVKFPEGLFDGGSFSENTYFSANIGFGVERSLMNRWSIFAQPTYHQGFIYLNEGLGPFTDKINTMSFFTGVRVQINR